MEVQYHVFQVLILWKFSRNIVRYLLPWENDAAAFYQNYVAGILSDCTNAVAVICGTAVGGAVICDRKVMRAKILWQVSLAIYLLTVKDCMNSDKTLAMTNGVPALIRLVAQKKNIRQKNWMEKKYFPWLIVVTMKC